MRSVLFLTSEREVEFTRRGAYRRLLAISVKSWKELTEVYSPTSVAACLESWGWGEELITFYLAHRQEVLKAARERARAHLARGEFPASSQFWKAILAAIELLKRFFNEPFKALDRTVVQLMEEHRDRVERDEAKEIVGNLVEFVVRNSPRFDPSSKTEVWGVKGEPGTTKQGRVFMLAKIFRERFCGEYGYDREVALRVLDERGLLLKDRPGDRSRRTARLTLNGQRVEGYLFNLSSFDLEGEEEEEESSPSLSL